MSEEKQNAVSIEQLRAGVENEHRFQTVFRGYDKKDVNEYLQELAENYQKTIDDLNQKRDTSIRDISNSYETLLSDLKQKKESEIQKLQSDSEKTIADLKQKKESEIQKLQSDST